MEEAVIAVTGDVQALQKQGGEGKVYYPMGCTLNFTPGWEVDSPAERQVFASPSSATCSIAIWVADGRRRFPTI